MDFFENNWGLILCLAAVLGPAGGAVLAYANLPLRACLWVAVSLLASLVVGAFILDELLWLLPANAPRNLIRSLFTPTVPFVIGFSLGLAGVALFRSRLALRRDFHRQKITPSKHQTAGYASGQAAAAPGRARHSDGE